jgi:ribosome recycling factor
MTLEETLFTAEEGMEKSLSYMSHEFATIRTGKASPSLVENLDVEAYGSAMKLKQLALITTPEPRLLLIQPFDAGTVRDIERAINESRIGIAPAVDGKLIRLPIPELSEERRKELARTVKQIAEESRVRIRGCRREAMETAKKLQKEGVLTEDDLRSAETEIQKLTDRFIEQVDKQVGSKEAELMKI